MAQPTLKEHYQNLLDEWADKPLLGTHVVGDVVITCTHMRWIVTSQNIEVKTGTIRSNKGAREAVKKAVMTWLKPQLR